MCDIDLVLEGPRERKSTGFGDSSETPSSALQAWLFSATALWKSRLVWVSNHGSVFNRTNQSQTGNKCGKSVD